MQGDLGWRALKVAGPLESNLTGILFAVSTYETDYVLVKQDSLHTAISALRSAGHTVILPA